MEPHLHAATAPLARGKATKGITLCVDLLAALCLEGGAQEPLVLRQNLPVAAIVQAL